MAGLAGNGESIVGDLSYHSRRMTLMKLRRVVWHGLIVTCRTVYHDEILHSLRAPSVIFDSLPFLRPRVPSDSRGRIHLKREGGDESHNGDRAQDQEREGGKTYEIPTGGLFYWVTFPNYLCEWYVPPPSPLCSIHLVGEDEQVDSDRG